MTIIKDLVSKKRTPAEIEEDRLHDLTDKFAKKIACVLLGEDDPDNLEKWQEHRTIVGLLEPLLHPLIVERESLKAERDNMRDGFWKTRDILLKTNLKLLELEEQLKKD